LAQRGALHAPGWEVSVGRAPYDLLCVNRLVGLGRDMQDRYAGDIGDFVKFGLLRELLAPAPASDRLRLGVNWYLTPNEAHNADGKHVTYLSRHNRWHGELRACDPDLMLRLAEVATGERSVQKLEMSGALPADTQFYREPVRPSFTRDARRRWHQAALTHLADAELVFADPDNGLRADARGSRAHKYALFDELADYANRGQSLLVYHHADRSADASKQARRRLAELVASTRLAACGGVIARRGTCRLFLLAAAEAHAFTLSTRLAEFAQHWSAHVDLSPPEPTSRSRSPRTAPPRPAKGPQPAPPTAATLSPSTPRSSFERVSTLNYASATAFAAAVPRGRWTSFKEVATAAGNPAAAMAIGNWLRESGGTIPNYWRIIRSDRFVPDGLTAHAPGLPHDASTARQRLIEEGIRFNGGRASPHQQFLYKDWRAPGGGAPAAPESTRRSRPSRPSGIQLGTIVRLKDPKSEEARTWTLVNRAEADLSSGRLSVESPIAQAVLGKAIGDEVTVATPKGERRYIIEDANPIVS
jgi:alkylated DNA nucleotide flippase Atl1